jgi:hypothetical protein
VRRHYAIPSLTSVELDRFWAKVAKSEGCWTWTASLNNGYGQFKVSGRMVLAHRISWLLHTGASPDLDVLHRCDNPLCVRPDHLFLGDQAANMRDMATKGRSAHGERHPSRLYPEQICRGERNGQAKLTAAKVREARARHAAGEGQRELARAFGVSQATMRFALLGRTWRSVA